MSTRPNSPPPPPVAQNPQQAQDDAANNTSHLMHTENPVLKPLVWFYNWYYGALLRPDDPFLMQVRKATIVVFFISAVALITTIQRLATEPKLLSTPSGAVYVATMLLRHVCCSVPAYFYCRFTRSAPDWLFTGFIFIQLTGELLVTIRSPGADAWYSIAEYCFLGISGHVRLKPVVIFYAFCVLFVNQLNKLPHPAFALPDSVIEVANSGQVLLAAGVFLVMCLWLHLTMSRFNAALASSKKSVVLSLDIARMLRDYDTDGVSVLLKEYDRDEDKNAELVVALRDINTNLEKYRPHLPNYVLARDELLDEEDSRANLETKTRSFASMRGGGGGAPDTPHSAASPRGCETTQILRQQQRGGVLPSTPLGSAHPSENERGPSTAHSRSRSASPVGTASVESSAERALRTVVTVCVLDVDWHGELSNATTMAVPATVLGFDSDRCHQLASGMHDIAATTMASMHSFVGDRIVATWNATRRVAKPEAKACSFADALRKHCAALSSSSGSVTCVRGCVVTGKAWSMFAGNNRVKTFATSSTSLWSRLHAALRQTRRYKTIAVDFNTRENAACDFATRGVAVVDPAADNNNVVSKSSQHLVGDAMIAMATTTGAPQQPLSLQNCFYELLHERPIAVRDQEWMYVLEGQSQDPNEVVSRAFELAAVGKYADAAEKLASLEESALATLPALDQLHSFVSRRLLQ